MLAFSLMALLCCMMTTSKAKPKGPPVMNLDEHIEALESLHICPMCAKMFLEEKGLYLHIMRAHQDDQRLAFDLQADLYRRWQQRIPHHEH
jgi:hypothetical protein